MSCVPIIYFSYLFEEKIKNEDKIYNNYYTIYSFKNNLEYFGCYKNVISSEIITPNVGYPC